MRGTHVTTCVVCPSENFGSPTVPSIEYRLQMLIHYLRFFPFISSSLVPLDWIRPVVLRQLLITCTLDPEFLLRSQSVLDYLVYKKISTVYLLFPPTVASVCCPRGRVALVRDEDECPQRTGGTRRQETVMSLPGSSLFS